MGKVFLIYTNIHKDKDLAQTRKVKGLLLSKGCNVYVYHELEGDLPSDIDYMLVLGGDGTMLQAVRDVKERHIPALGINLGTLGYMTEVEPEQIEVAIEKLLSGQAMTEERMMLKASVSQQGKEQKEEQWALNDVVISRRGSLQIHEFDIFVNGQFLKKYSADGIIVTTPTGSTGYNLSAGGPIVDPKTQLLMITPICPHTFNQRSIVLSKDDEIVVEIPAGREGMSQQVEASFDGSHQMMLQTGDRITISKWEKEAVFLKLNQVSFLEILSRKMSEN